MISMNIHGVRKLSALSHSGDTCHWVTIACDADDAASVTLFFPDFATADAYAIAINSVWAPVEQQEAA